MNNGHETWTMLTILLSIALVWILDCYMQLSEAH